MKKNMMIVGLVAATALGCGRSSSEVSLAEPTESQVIDSGELVFNVEGLT